ncbi:Stage II sporulation protein [Lentibacillus sp. JNUCC-1]|uniref:M23 family metallopeptidase n=1 Tax=Lentibacillus sp. JNUCC-1 TaxID=2654513 RepID=UPI0012E983B7|nr:M23 family metallopeptidase [Lentibacillus sp. JNUCC-1]MUV37369.1 Stage II sporulation protein [Lentibacillus sp. JNUCC-1]
MKEEQNPKSSWRRIFRKKWFFPAVYLTVAALLLTVVVWYQNIDNQMPDMTEDQDEIADNNYVPDPFDEDADPVVDQEEVVGMPAAEDVQAEIVTKFYDYNAEDTDKQQALVQHNNRWYQSTGIDMAAASGETFDVLASMGGEVSEVKEDPLLGHVVSLSHGNDVETHYASMGDVTVKKGDKVKQGDVLGTAGKNLFGKDNGIHVHFELHKGDQKFNPETYFNQPVSKMDEAESESVQTEEDAEPSDIDDLLEEKEDHPEGIPEESETE